MQHADMAREKIFNVRFSGEEWGRLEALAAHFALNVASLIRMLAKEKADTLGLKIEAPAKAKKSAKR